MNNKEFRELHYQYCNNPENINREQLYSLIDYLHKENEQYLETIKGISENRDNEDKEPFSSFKEDMD